MVDDKTCPSATSNPPQMFQVSPEEDVDVRSFRTRIGAVAHDDAKRQRGLRQRDSTN